MNSSNENISEGENGTKERKAKISKLAIASVFLGLLGFFIIVLRITAYRPWWSEFVGRNVIGLSGIVGLILGMVALARISRRMAAITILVILSPFFLFYSSIIIGSRLLVACAFYAMLACLVGLLIAGAVLHLKSSWRERFKGAAFTILGVVMTTLLSVFWWAETCGPVSTALAGACGSNLHRLGKATQAYAQDNQGQYPEPNQWCDLLLRHTDVDDNHFLCPGVRFRWRRQVFPWPIPKKASCYYAMNPDCQLTSPNDIVLLFEIRGGWNQYGGPDLLTFDNHGVKGCSVIFNDGHVEFVRPQHLEKLKWKVQEDENKPAEPDVNSIE